LGGPKRATYRWQLNLRCSDGWLVPDHRHGTYLFGVSMTDQRRSGYGVLDVATSPPSSVPNQSLPQISLPTNKFIKSDPARCVSVHGAAGQVIVRLQLKRIAFFENLARYLIGI
jgi:hypothetical protein